MLEFPPRFLPEIPENGPKFVKVGPSLAGVAPISAESRQVCLSIRPNSAQHWPRLGLIWPSVGGVARIRPESASRFGESLGSSARVDPVQEKSDKRTLWNDD